jgi:hypothetical protein
MANEFISHDLYLAAFLQAHGTRLIRTERVGNRVNFVFAGGDKTDKLCNQFINNGNVPIGDLRRCLNDLKTVIFH